MTIDQINQQLTELSTSTGEINQVTVTATNGKTYMIDLNTLIIPPYIDPKCNIEGATFAFIKAYAQ